MGAVDPSDDRLLRYIVRHYRYDEVRREQRHVEIGAYDDLDEFEAAIALAVHALAARRAGGGVDPREHISGVVKDPGYQAAQRWRRSAARLIV